MIDWGGVGTHFPPQKSDPGFGVYHFKSGFNSSLEYFTGYYDLVFAHWHYHSFRLLERRVAGAAWSLRARLNGTWTQMKNITHTSTRKWRQFRISLSQQGLRTTLFWAAFGYLKPNRFTILARDLTGDKATWRPRRSVRCEVWDAKDMRAWRQQHPGLPTEFYQDEIDDVDSCAVALVDGALAGLIWIYRSDAASRLFRFDALEAELNQGYILPAYRGMGLFKDILTYACCWLQRQDYQTVYAGVHAANTPSLRAFLGAEFRPRGNAWHFLMFRPKVREHDLRKRSLHRQTRRATCKGV